MWFPQIIAILVDCAGDDKTALSLVKAITRSYVPGKASLKSCWSFYPDAYLAYVSILSWVGLELLAAPLRFVGFLLAAAGVRIGIQRYRRRHLSLDFSLAFRERPEPAVRMLGTTERGTAPAGAACESNKDIALE